jgi:hypothetical protein
MLALSTALLVVVGGLGVAWLATRQAPAYARGPGHFYVAETDYRFSPEQMTWRVGEQVTLTFVNHSEAHPGKTHEFMMGHVPRTESTPLGVRQMDGFRQDFFDDVTVTVSRASGVEMLMTGMAKVVGPDASQPWVMRMGMSDSGMGTPTTTMPGMGTPTTTMPGMGTPTTTMPGMGGPTTTMQGMSGSNEMSGMTMAGFMLVLEPEGTATVSFTVPDKPGRWQFGCFEQSGQHFLNGMKGWVTIRP